MAWQLDYPHAEFHSDRWSAVLDLANARNGLTQLVAGSQSLRGALMGVAVGRPSEAAGAIDQGDCEAYLRGDDLVAVYDRLQQNSLRTSIYWRATGSTHNDDPGESMLLMVSVETDLLDNWPAVQISSELNAAELLLMESADENVGRCGSTWNAVKPSSEGCLHYPTAVLMRPHDCDVSYLEMTHPSDFQSLDYEHHNGAVSVCWNLLGQFLEKGVIRRARLQGVWLPRQDDQQTAVERYRRFADSAAPLTA